MPNRSRFCYMVSGIALAGGQQCNPNIEYLREPCAKRLIAYVFSPPFCCANLTLTEYFFSKSTKVSVPMVPRGLFFADSPPEHSVLNFRRKMYPKIFSRHGCFCRNFHYQIGNLAFLLPASTASELYKLQKWGLVHFFCYRGVFGFCEIICSRFIFWDFPIADFFELSSRQKLLSILSGHRIKLYPFLFCANLCNGWAVHEKMAINF